MTHTQVFRGRTLAEARRAAVHALGADAAVLTTRKVPRLGLAGWLGSVDIEVVASAAPEPSRGSTTPFASGAYQTAPAKEEKESEKVPPRSDVSALRAEVRSELRALKSAVSQPPAVPDELLAELAALREAVAAMTPEERKGDKLAALVKAAGVEGPAAVALRDAALVQPEGGPRERFLAALAGMVRVSPWPLSTGQPTLVALVGPTGVGKTTTAGKLAARARMEGRSVTLVACDGYRVGAVEHLRRYAELLGAGFEVAPTREALAAVLAECRSDLVVVDTAGRAPTKTGPESLLSPEAYARTMANNPRARHVLLCVPASLRSCDAARLVRSFSAAAPDALVVTKIDETTSPSGLVHGPVAAHLPVSVLCFGQRVPEDIAPATMGAIVDHLAPAARKTRATP